LLTQRNNIVIGITCLFDALVADRIFKYAVSQRLSHGALEFSDGILRIGYFTNTGIGLGIQLPAWLIVAAASLIIFCLIIWLVKYYGRIMPLVRWAIGLILIGSISNLYDRIIFGHVIDVFNFNDWSVFNAADLWIVIGVFIIIIEMVVVKKPATKNSRNINGL
jgi:signal peptidase II